MFETYSDSARRVVVLTTEEARVLGHGYVGTEHLLAAISRHSGRGSATLAHFGLTNTYIREATIETIGRGLGDRTGHLPFTPQAKEALMLAAQEASAIGNTEIDDTHLLLGLLSLDAGVGLSVVLKKEPNVSVIREALLKDMAITRNINAEVDGSKLREALRDLVEAGAAQNATEFERGAASAAERVIGLIDQDVSL